MARKIEFTIDVAGEEKDAFIKLSSAVDKAAMQKAYDEDMTPMDALAELTGFDKSLVTGTEEEEDDDE